MLLELPFELQLIILKYVRAENHLDLCTLAQTCTYFFRLVADRYNWTDTVTLVQSTTFKDVSYLTSALKRSDQYTKLPIKRLLSVSTDLQLVQCILEHSNSTLEDIKLFMNKSHHHKFIIDTLTTLPKLAHLTLRDPADDVSIMDHCHKLITTVLSREQLITLDIPSLALNPFLMSPASAFHQLRSLSITILVACSDVRLYWQRLKQLFPNLNHLTVTLPSQQQLNVFRDLLTNVQLFPWIKRVTLLSKENPKHFLNRDDLRTSLLQLEGLNRITAGWDMIALN